MMEKDRTKTSSLEHDNPLKVGLFLTIAVAALVISISAWIFNFSRSTLPQDIVQLEERLLHLEQRLSALEEQQQNTISSLQTQTTHILKQNLSPISETLQILQRNIQQNSQNIQFFPQALQQIETKIQNLEDNLQAIPTINQTIRILLAIGQLRLALQREQPFQGELITLRLSGFDDRQILQHLDLITPWATHGIISQSRLIEQFQNTASDIVEATLYQRPLALVLDRVLGLLKAFTPSMYHIAQLQNFFTIRNTINRALDDLKNNRLTDSIERLSLLTEKGIYELKPLLKEMRSRLQANRIQALLHDHMVLLEVRLKNQ